MRAILLVSAVLALAVAQMNDDLSENKLPFEDGNQTSAEPERPPSLIVKFMCEADLFKPNSTVGATCNNDATVMIINPTDVDYTGGKLMVYASPQCSDRESWELLNEGSLIDVPAIDAGENTTIDVAAVETVPGLACGIGCFVINVTGDSSVMGGRARAGFKSECDTPPDVDIELVLNKEPTEPIELKWGQNLQEALDDAGITVSLKAKTGFVKPRSSELALSVFVYLRDYHYDNIDGWFDQLQLDDQSIVGRKMERDGMDFNDNSFREDYGTGYTGYTGDTGNSGGSGATGNFNGTGFSGTGGMGMTTTSRGKQDKPTEKPSTMDKITQRPQVGRRKRAAGNSTGPLNITTTPDYANKMSDMDYVNPVRSLWSETVWDVLGLGNRNFSSNKTCETYYPHSDIDNLLANPDVMVLGEVGPNAREIKFSEVDMITTNGWCGGDQVIDLMIAADAFSMLEEGKLCNNFVKIPVRLACPLEYSQPTQCDILIDPRSRGHRVVLTQSNYVVSSWNGFGSQFRSTMVDYAEMYELYMFKYMEKRFQKIAAENPEICQLAEDFDSSMEQSYMSRIVERQREKRNAAFNGDDAFNKMAEVLNAIVEKANDSNVKNITEDMGCKFIGILGNAWLLYARRDYRSINLIIKFTPIVYEKAGEALENCKHRFETWADDDLNEENWFLVPNDEVTDAIASGFSEFQGAHGDFLRAAFTEITAMQAMMMEMKDNGTEFDPEKFKNFIKNGTCPDEVKTSFSEKAIAGQFHTYLKESTALLAEGGRYAPLDGDHLCGQGLLQEWVARGGPSFIGKRLKKFKRPSNAYLSGLYKRFMARLAEEVKDNVTDPGDLRDKMVKYLNESLRADKDMCEAGSESKINNVLPVYWRMDGGKIFMGLRSPLEGDYGSAAGQRKALWKYVATCTCERCNWYGKGGSGSSGSGSWTGSGSGSSGSGSWTGSESGSSGSGSSGSGLSGATTRRSLTG